MLNRALFDRITIDDEDDATLQPTEAIQTILATSPRPHNERTLPRDHAGQGSNVQLYVDPGGLEPPTPCMPCRCATSCAMGPYETASPSRATHTAYNVVEDQAKSTASDGRVGRSMAIAGQSFQSRSSA